MTDDTLYIQVAVSRVAVSPKQKSMKGRIYMEERIKLLENQVVDLQEQIVELQNILAEYKTEIENCHNRMSDLRNNVIAYKASHPDFGVYEKYNKCKINIWKKYIGKPLLEQFTELYSKCRRIDKNDNPFVDPLDIVYATMAKSFGFNKSNALNTFKDKYGETLSVFDTIASESIYQMYYTQSINKLINVYSKKFSDLCSYDFCNSETVDIEKGNKEEDVFVQVFNDEITHETDVDEAIEIVARYLSDTNPKRQKTLLSIYDNMFTPEQWKVEIEDLRLMGVKHPTKKESFKISKRCRDKCLDACANIVLDKKAMMFGKIVV